MIQKALDKKWYKKVQEKIGTKNWIQRLAQKNTMGNWCKSVSKNKRESKMAQKD